MNHGLLIGTLALMLSTTLQTPGEDAADPYQWLEEILGDKPLAWIKERNAESVGELARTEPFHALDHRILGILDLDVAASRPSRKSARITTTFSANARNPRGLWRRTTLDEYRKDKPNWEIVLDLDELGKEEKVNWVWHGAQALKPENKLALISIFARVRRREGDLRPDLTTKSFVKDGYTLARGQGVRFPGVERTAWVCRYRLQPGLVDQVGLSANCQGMETRHTAGRGRGRIRGEAR